MCLTAPDDVCVPEEEQARPIYRAGSDQLTQGRGGSAPFQKWVSLAVSFLFFSKGSFFLFLEGLDQVQIRRAAAAGVQAPQINCQLAGDGDDGFFAPAPVLFLG